jgi:protein-L-isoaspartate O-methyltransferase
VPFVPREVAEPDPQAEAFKQMKEVLKNGGVQHVVADQLFPTPPDLVERMLEAAEIESGMQVLEPSAGTGAIVKAIVTAVDTEVLAYEINSSLVAKLSSTFPSYRLQARQADFLEVTEGMGQFDRVLMNPPFKNGDDIKHITHALKFLRPGGRLVAICANGPRQMEKLFPLTQEMDGSWEALAEGTFKEQGTGVSTAMLVFNAPAAVPVELPSLLTLLEQA